MIPKKLKYGDTIGIITPASPEYSDDVTAKLNYIRNLGFKVKEGKHFCSKRGFLAGSDTDRASDFMEMFMDADIDAIFCYRGGYGSARLLPLIDFTVVQKNPKIFVGFSDITTLLNEISLKYNLITFHGPMASSDLTNEITLKSLLKTLMNCDIPYKIDIPNSYPVECPIHGKVQGTLIGGNLSLICSTMGTPYEINMDDKILFIEDVNEEPYRIDRMLTQLLLSGKLQRCRGFILGQFKGCTLPNYNRSLTLDEILEDRLLSLNKPTMMKFSAGHGSPRLTLPIGAKICLNCDNGIVEVLEPVVR